ncbi:MAG: phospholipase D/Transphosphatidylase [Betaproteobacteria bacterium]|nr:phospholipase D/Transphosphatidylase [Betaproteobacteria bacterium]
MRLLMSMRLACFMLVVAFVSGCATLPPGSDFPKTPSWALATSTETRLGRQFESAAREHGGKSGYRLLSAGIDGLTARAQMIDAAALTLDVQYYIFRNDKTGRLVADALLRAADRGVRVRVLVDEGERVAGDEQIELLDAHPKIEVRLFNPFAYRGHAKTVRSLEFMLNARRLDYRMHNKLLVVDNAAAIIGGRNIGDEYFQVDPESQFGDDDVFAGGPIARQLSATFDEYWNSALAIPVRALGNGRPSQAQLDTYRKELAEHRQALTADRTDYLGHIAKGEPFAGMVSGKLPLAWASAQLVYDSPEKRRVDKGERPGNLIYPPVIDTTQAVQSELLIVTPFFVPGPSGMELFKALRERNVRVRVLTNSLEATPELMAHSGYMHYRRPLLEEGIELYEVRAQLGTASGSGESPGMVAYGRYALHAKLFVFDGTKVLIGSINFDLRSKHRNTEIGLIIDSPALAQQTSKRFAALVQPANSYELVLTRDQAMGPARLVWRTKDNGQMVEYDREPAGGEWRRAKVQLLTLLPLDPEL